MGYSYYSNICLSSNVSNKPNKIDNICFCNQIYLTFGLFAIKKYIVGYIKKILTQEYINIGCQISNYLPFLL